MVSLTCCGGEQLEVFPVLVQLQLVLHAAAPLAAAAGRRQLPVPRRHGPVRPAPRAHQTPLHRIRPDV